MDGGAGTGEGVGGGGGEEVLARSRRAAGREGVAVALGEAAREASVGRRGAGAAGARPLKLRFHPVELVGSATGVQPSLMQVVLLDGRRVRVPAGFASDDLERVLQVLGERRRC
jgi:hypothetical protein